MYTITTAGDVLDEVNGAAPNPVWKRSEVYVGGKHLATVTSTTVVFVHGDWIGTERVRTNMSGVICETTASQPFGDNVQQSGSCNVSPDFLTGKPRDAESNLDDFGARYFSSQWGRWMSADWTAGASAVPYATLTNPQSLNLYAYVGNDPIDGQDPDGHAVYDKGPAGCAAYASMCYGAGSGFGDDVRPPEEMSDADIEYYQERLQQNAGNGANTAQTATTPASATAQSSSTAQQTNLTGEIRNIPKYNFALDLTGLSPNVQFNTQSSNVHPEFTPSTAAALNSALTTLNQAGIVPTFNSAFRTFADQARMRNGGSGSRPAALFSWHEAGNAVDIQPGRSFSTIRSVMQQNGFTWGGNWKGIQYDPVHFELQRPHSELFIDILKAQAAWSAQH